MAFCTNCGADVQPGVRFCPNCGTALAAADATSQTPKQEAPKAEYHPAQDARPVYNVYTADIQDNRLLCIFCYLGLMVLIPFQMKPNSPFVRFHCNQGLVLTLFCIACAVVAIIPILGWIAAIAGGIFALVCLIIGIVNACCGHMNPLPLIGRISILR